MGKKTGIDLIAAERRRQVRAEGWTAAHDDAHDDQHLAFAAACYATPCHMREETHKRGAGDQQVPRLWPWEDAWWKPTPEDRVRELVKAGALIAAEIDRLLRAKAKDGA